MSQMLWPLSMPEGPTLLNLIFPPSPVSSTFHKAARIAAASGLPALVTAAAIVRMPSYPRKLSVRPANA